jgi:hypothetical protein
MCPNEKKPDVQAYKSSFQSRECSFSFFLIHNHSKSELARSCARSDFERK